MTLTIDQNFTPNCEPRRDGKEITYLILHYTGCPAATAAARWLDPSPNAQGGRLSTHYMVDERGRIIQFVHEKMRAWHAGQSFWRGETDLNSVSIGIEIENLGEYADYPPFNPDQIAVVIDLCRDIIKRHPSIKPHHVLGHSDIAPGRKLDPGPQFPWAKLAAAGIGVMPGTPTPQSGGGVDTTQLDSLLTEFGYNPDVPLDVKWQAFCTHYAPEGLEDHGYHKAVQKLQGMIRSF
jgi:N-acetylmuramoyl-L-alanine amidase